MLEYDSLSSDVGEIPSLQRKANFHLERVSRFVFASTAELCLVNFSLFSLLWNCGIAVTFYFFMLLLTFLFVSLILILLILNTLFRDQS